MSLTWLKLPFCCLVFLIAFIFALLSFLALSLWAGSGNSQFLWFLGCRYSMGGVVKLVHGLRGWNVFWDGERHVGVEPLKSSTILSFFRDKWLVMSESCFLWLWQDVYSVLMNSTLTDLHSNLSLFIFFSVSSATNGHFACELGSSQLLCSC